MRIPGLLAKALPLLFIPALASAAPTPAVVPGNPVSSLAFLAQVVEGWQFTPTTNIVVSALGFSDVGGDGLADNHLVGILRVSDLAVIASATITTNSTLQGSYRYASISPVLLNAGVAYQIMGTFPSVNDAEVVPTLATTQFNNVTYQGFGGNAGTSLGLIGNLSNDVNGFTRISSNFLQEPFVAPVVPTLGEWGMFTLAVLMAAAGWFLSGRQIA